MDGRQLKRILKVHQRIADAYQDPRFPENGPNTRLLAVTMLWVAGIERVAGTKEQWDRVCTLLRLSQQGLGEMFRQDLPRWESGWQAGLSLAVCEAPMIRRDVCGRATRTVFKVTDPADGTWRMAGFCPRHQEFAAERRRAELALRRAGGVPVPAPNTGGLLPCYLGGNWADIYAYAGRPGWKPPAEGLRADDWPVLARVAGHAPPKLVVLPGDGEDAAVADAPVLQLVPGDC